MIGIDLFAGAGGMTLGAKLAGIKVKYAVEIDPHAAATYKLNHNEVKLITKDIRTVKKSDLKRTRNKQLVIFGGPPCQGFSTSNQKTRNKDNQNNWLYSEFFRIAQLFDPLPEWLVFENVKGFSETENGMFLDKVFAVAEGLGYSVSSATLNAAQFGVPQRRSRFFAIASREGHSISLESDKDFNTVTVGDALNDLPILQPGSNIDIKRYAGGKKPSTYAANMRSGLKMCSGHLVTRNSTNVLRRYPHIPQGGNWENIPKELMDNYTDETRCHTGIYYRLKADEPSIVIGNYRKNMLIHPTQNRGLSVREAARIQSFPDTYEFQGSIGFQQQQVGNAVPPLLAKFVFEQILKSSL